MESRKPTFFPRIFLLTYDVSLDDRKQYRYQQKVEETWPNHSQGFWEVTLGSDLIPLMNINTGNARNVASRFIEKIVKIQI